jgi:hypothetical protein
MVGKPLAGDVLAHATQAFKERRRLTGIVIGVVRGDGLAHHGLRREADH